MRVRISGLRLVDDPTTWPSRPLILPDGVPPSCELSPVRGACLTWSPTPAGEFCGAWLMVCPTALPANNAAAVAAMKNVLFMITPRFSSGLRGNSAHRQAFRLFETYKIIVVSDGTEYSMMMFLWVERQRTGPGCQTISSCQRSS